MMLSPISLMCASLCVAMARDNLPTGADNDVKDQCMVIVESDDDQGDISTEIAKQNLGKKVEGVIEKLKTYGLTTEKKLNVQGTLILFLKGHCNKIEDAANQITGMKHKEQVQKVSIAKSSACTSQTTYGYMWGLDRIDQRGQIDNFWQGEYLYPTGPGDHVDAYIVDTGIRTDHELFEDRAEWGYTTEFWPDDRNETNEDGHGHGTHVAGTVGSTLYGVAKDVNLIAVKVLGSDGWGTTEGVVDGLYWAFKDHIKKNEALSKTCKLGKGKKRWSGKCHKGVVNMSLGGFGSPGMAEEVMVNTMVDNGMVVVVAAGNSAADSCFYAPAGISSAITVGATDHNDEIAWWSNSGECVDVFAPGVRIKSTFNRSSNDTLVASGTSMASPHVAGVVANFLKTTKEPLTKDSVMKWLKKKGTRRNKVGLETCSQRCSLNRLIYQRC